MKKIFKVLLAAPLALSFLLVGTACDYEITKRPGKKTSITDDSGEIVIGNWIAVDKTVFEYDDENTSTSIHYTWSMEKNAWQEDYKSETQYNDKGDWVMQTDYRWDEWTGEWIGSFKIVVDDQNKTHIHYSWDSELYDWRISSKQVSIWDGDFPIREEQYNWSNETNDWVLYGIGRYEYDDREATSLIEWSHYNEYTHNWVYERKTEMEYSEDWKIWTSTEYWWQNDSWVKSGKHIEEFNDFDATSSLIDYRWVEEDSDWKENRKRTYQYNKNKKCILEMEYNWSYETNSYVESGKTVNTYNEDGRQTLSVRFVLQEI